AAQRQLDLALAAHPEDPVVSFAGVLLSLWRRQPEAGREHLQRLRLLLPRERFEQRERVVKVLGTALQRADGSAGLAQLGQLVAAVQLGPLVVQGPGLGLASPS